MDRAWADPYNKDEVLDACAYHSWNDRPERQEEFKNRGIKSEAELRSLWSAPDTRAKLLEGLREGGFGHDQLAEMQRIIDAEKSDLFDVLAYVAYAMPPITREVRAANARVHINSQFTAKQQAFLDFVLSHYVSVGVEELDQEKLTPLLRLKYHDSILDAVADLGEPDQIGKTFSGFQKYLYTAPV